MKKVFRYIEPLWTGKDGCISLRSILAIAFSVNFISNISYAIQKWDAGRSLDGLALILGIEAGLIAALLALKMYQSNVEFLKGGGYGDSTKNDNPPPFCPGGNQPLPV